MELFERIANEPVPIPPPGMDLTDEVISAPRGVCDEMDSWMCAVCVSVRS